MASLLEPRPGNMPRSWPSLDFIFLLTQVGVRQAYGFRNFNNYRTRVKVLFA